MVNKSYVLITPARNEEAHIEETIRSVIEQTLLPLEWVIVSDGSTDRTDEIVDSYASKIDFIKFVKASNEQKRNFGSKVNAFRAGYGKLETQDYTYIGNLDADITFGKNYFESLLKRFEENQKLGLGGGIICELVDGEFKKQRISTNSVAGAVQLFRRTCYEDIGGYIPLKFGGIDAAAEIMARMKGWQVRTFPEYEIQHHRNVGTANVSKFKSLAFRRGITNYVLGYHPLFQLLISIRNITVKPYILYGILSLTGYFWAFYKKYKRPYSDEIIKFLRTEQLERIGLKTFSSRFYK